MAMAGIGLKNGGEQRLGIRMAGATMDVISSRELHDSSEIHDGYAIGDMLHHGEVVRDEKVAQAHLALEVQHQVEHLALDGDVERGDRFITHDQTGFEGDGPGDADALALATREFERIAINSRSRQADLAEEFADLVPSPGGITQRVNDKRFGQDLSDGMARIQRFHGILKDHLQLTPERAQLRLAERSKFAVLKGNVAGSRPEEAHNAFAQGGFAAAGFADQSDGFTRLERQADAVNGPVPLGSPSKKAGTNGEVHTQIPNLKEGRTHGAAGGKTGRFRQRWQAVSWPGATLSRGGCTAQASMRYAQRF